MEINLPPNLQQFVDQQVATGVYPSAHEVVCDAIKSLREQQSRKELQQQLFRELDESIAQEERGEVVEVPIEKLDEYFDDIKMRGRERFRQSNGGQS